MTGVYRRLAVAVFFALSAAFVLNSGWLAPEVFAVTFGSAQENRQRAVASLGGPDIHVIDRHRPATHTGRHILALSPSNASVATQTCVYDDHADSDSVPGTLRVIASTTQDNCSARSAEVRAWISGGQTCQTGAPFGSACRVEQMDGETNATVTVIRSACGTADGYSSHYMWNPQVVIAEGTQTPPGGPILIETKKNADYKLTSAADGVYFDMDGDGVTERVGWTHVSSSAAFLALDRNDDGQITSGKELFGGSTFPGVSSGFKALQMTAMATNGGIKRGTVSSDDPVFDELLLWTDRNHNGIGEKWELRPAKDELSAIGLLYELVRQPDGLGNHLLWKGWAHLRSGPGRNKPKTAEEDEARAIVIWDVLFAIQK